MMRILILIIMLLPCSLGMYASAIDSLLSVLDKTIVMRRQYEEEKERYISLIKDELKQGRLTDMERYLIQNRLFAEYNSYISDSALHYINENILIATRLNNRQWINSSILNKVHILNTSSLFVEAMELLKSLPRNTLEGENIVGYTYEKSIWEQIGGSNNDFSFDNTKYWDLGSGSYLKDGLASLYSGRSESTLIGFFGRLNYNWKDMLFASASLRYEGSSKFGANQKWGYFPAASLAWEMMEMGFMKNTRKVLTSLKPRVSFGITGRSDFDAYKSLSTYNTNGSYLFDGRWVTGYAPSSNANPDLAWEKSVAINLGVDFVLWNRLRGSVEYFDRSSKDLLYTYTAPQPPFVYSTILVNVGTTKNTGIEVSLDGDILTKTAVKWTSGINYSYGKTKLTKLSNDIYKASYLDLYLKPGTGSSEYFFRVQEGGEIGQFYGYEYAGVDENGNMLILNDKDEQIPISQADAKYKRYIGNGAPKHFLSWSNNLTWRNFDLSVFFRGTFGFDVFNMRKYGMGLQGCGTDNVLRSAYLEDKNIRTGGGVISSYFLEDGSFIKLENVTLGYNFTPKNRKLLDNMRIYLSAKNLFTLTGYSGNDPSIIDVNGIQPGVDSNSAYPTATQLSLGVTLRFK